MHTDSKSFYPELAFYLFFVHGETHNQCKSMMFWQRNFCEDFDPGRLDFLVFGSLARLKDRIRFNG